MIGRAVQHGKKGAAMGFFRKLFGGSGRQSPANPSDDPTNPGADLKRLFETHAALAREKQYALEEFLGDSGQCRLSIDTGLIHFTDPVNKRLSTFPIQLVGSESAIDHTWLWAWANDPVMRACPIELLRWVKQLQAFGLEQKVAELTTGKLNLGAQVGQPWFNGHFLTLVASGVCSADCYYPIPYDGGVLFVLLVAPEVRASADPLLMTIRMTGFLLDLTSFYRVVGLGHKNILLNYARQKGWEIVQNNERKVKCTTSVGRSLIVVFDKLGHVMSCDVI
jgi:hypothetical protein